MQLIELGLVVLRRVCTAGCVNRLSNRHTTSLDRRHITRCGNTLFGTYATHFSYYLHLNTYSLFASAIFFTGS